MCFAPQRRALFRHFSTSEPPKVVRDRQFLTLLTWKCASRHNGVHFFDIATSKSGPELRCFVHFDLEMCFAPQRRALFRHHNFQKWSGAAVFCTFWLGNVLRATTACTFLTSQLPKVVREWCVLYILTSKCASHHNGVQFFISRLASWLRTRRFSEPTFRPSGATNHWKNTVFRDFPTFSRICIFCLLSASALLCFSSLHIVGSLTSKLPSIIYITYYHVDSTNGSKWWITETNRERTPRRLNYGTLIGRSPLGRLSGWDPGPSSITTTSLVWAESTKNTPGNAEWRVIQSTWGRERKGRLAGKKTKRTDADPTLSFHQHVPMTCWTITICPRSCSTGKIYVASAHVPPNCRVLCRKQLGEKAHLQNRKRFERVHIIYLIGFLLSIFEASIDHLNYQTHRLIKPEVSTIQPSYPHHIPMKRLVLYGFILKSPLIYQSSWEFHKSYKSPIHKSYKSFNEFRMFRIIVPPNPPQKNGGLSKFYSHEK